MASIGYSVSGTCHLALLACVILLSAVRPTPMPATWGRQSVLTVDFASLRPTGAERVTDEAPRAVVDLVVPRFVSPSPASAGIEPLDARAVPVLRLAPTTLPADLLDPPPADRGPPEKRTTPQVVMHGARSADFTAPERTDFTPAHPKPIDRQLSDAPRTRPVSAAPVGWASSTAARPRHNPPPEYPAEAVRRRIHGRVTLRITISTAGTVSHIEIADSSGYHLFDQAAREAVERWTFEPAERNGQPVVSTVLLPIRFLPR